MESQSWSRLFKADNNKNLDHINAQKSRFFNKKRLFKLIWVWNLYNYKVTLFPNVMSGT
jgi:hypothetical protein